MKHECGLNRAKKINDSILVCILNRGRLMLLLCFLLPTSPQPQHESKCSEVYMGEACKDTAVGAA